MIYDTGRCRASMTARRSAENARARVKPQSDAHDKRELHGESAKPERTNDGKIPLGGKEEPGERSGLVLHPCVIGSRAKVEARHSPYTAPRPQRT